MNKWEFVNNCNRHDWGSLWHMEYCKILSDGLARVIRSLDEYSQRTEYDGIGYK